MRALLLLLLGGALVWFVWYSFGSGAQGAVVGAHAPGRMLPPEGAPRPAPEATAPAAPQLAKAEAGQAGAEALPTSRSQARVELATPIATVLAPAGSAVGSAVGSSAAPPSTPAPSAAAGSSPASSAQAAPARPPALASELELARALVSDPDGFAAFLATRSDVSRSRRDLALALAKAVTGGEAEARRLLADLGDAPDVRASEREFLARLLDGRSSGLVLASAADESPLVRAAAMVSDARAADAARTAGGAKEAARTYSALLLEYVRAAWRPDAAVLRRWTGALTEVQRAHRWNKAGDWPALTVTVKPGDSLIALRKRVVQDRPDLLLYTGQIERANQLMGAVIRPGQTLRIPTDRARVLVDLDAHWAFYLLGDEVAAAWEVGVGQESTATQVGTFRVGDRKENPMWFRAGHEPVPYDDPENPLGTRWIAWVLPDGQGTGLGFHGTNDPTSIGKDQSQGCIRMRNEDVEELYDILPTGTEIRVQP